MMSIRNIQLYIRASLKKTLKINFALLVIFTNTAIFSLMRNPCNKAITDYFGIATLSQALINGLLIVIFVDLTWEYIFKGIIIGVIGWFLAEQAAPKMLAEYGFTCPPPVYWNTPFGLGMLIFLCVGMIVYCFWGNTSSMEIEQTTTSSYTIDENF
jgi:hypothetical protein